MAPRHRFRLTGGHEAHGAAQAAAFELIAHAAELSASKFALHVKEIAGNMSASGWLPEAPVLPVQFERARPATIEIGRSIERKCQASRLPLE